MGYGEKIKSNFVDKISFQSQVFNLYLGHFLQNIFRKQNYKLQTLLIRSLFQYRLVPAILNIANLKWRSLFQSDLFQNLSSVAQEAV